jgi:hypothetical protein
MPDLQISDLPPGNQTDLSAGAEFPADVGSGHTTKKYDYMKLAQALALRGGVADAMQDIRASARIFRGYYSSVQPADPSLKAGYLWYRGSGPDMPLGLPWTGANLKQWNGSAWVQADTYTPDIWDGWEDLNNGQGYYWFNGAWKLDDEVTVFLATMVLVLQDIGAMGVKESQKTIRQRIQEGSSLIYNRGVIAGCTSSKAASGRKVLLAPGGVFARGVEIPCKGDQTGIAVPANTGGAALAYYGYLTVGADSALAFVCTGAGEVVPDGGIPICRISVPAGNTAGNLEGVTITDVRRYEPAYPTLINSISYASVALPYSMIDTDYAVMLDVTGYSGGWNQRPYVYANEKAANGFKVFADGTLDEVIVQWKAIKSKL